MERRDANWIEERAAAYFAACDATKEVSQKKDGSLSVRQVPYTMAGLAAALMMDRSELERALAPRSRILSKEGRRVLRVAAARVEQYTVERTLMGELNAAAAGVFLRDWGYGAAAEREEGGMLITLEDKEGFGR